MIGVFIAGIFNSFLLWCFLLLTYYRGYEYFIYNKIPFGSSEMHQAAYLSITITAFIVFLFSTKFSDRFFNLIEMNRKPIAREGNRLYPLFEEVQGKVAEKYGYKKLDVDLRIKDSKMINLCALGTKTVVINRDAYESLSDEALKGVIAHELGHVFRRDSLHMGIIYMLIGLCCLLIMLSAMIAVGAYLIGIRFNRGLTVFLGLGLLFVALIVGVGFAALVSTFFICNIFLKKCYRVNEFRADAFAASLGYGAPLLEFLEGAKEGDYRFKNIIKYLFSTHPKTILRIGRLEEKLEQSGEPLQA